MSAGQVRCLVTGATGYIGGRVVPRLLDEGHRVRALARDPLKLADVPWREQAEVARGDLGDVDSLIAAFDGMDVVYYLVHSMGTSKDFAAEETRAVRNFVTAARRTGVRRVVYLSGLHPESSKLSPHLESRKAVGEALIDSADSSERRNTEAMWRLRWALCARPDTARWSWRSRSGSLG